MCSLRPSSSSGSRRTGNPGASTPPRRVAAEVAAARRELARALAEVPVVRRVWPGAANFLLLELDGGPAVVAGLAASGIAVRPCESFPGLGSGHVRVAVRHDADNRLLVEALAG